MDAIRARALCLIVAGLTMACEGDRGTGAHSRPTVETEDATAPRAAAPEGVDLFVYSPAGRRDPFRPPVEGQPDRSRDARGRERGPLERFDLEQLKLEGIVWGLPNPWALVATPDGLGHRIRRGAPIGRDGGTVESIKPGEVVVARTTIGERNNRVTLRASLFLHPR
jgi:type IV pilus assembly protein PilP